MAGRARAGLLLLPVAAVLGSPFDPHPTPPAGRSPFFDGWYVRLVDHAGDLAAAVIFAGYQPAHHSGYNQSWVALLYRAPGVTETLTEQLFLEQSSVHIVPRSQATPGAPSSFRWQSPVGTVDVDGDTASLEFRFKALRLSAQLSRRVPWDADRPDSAGPEGWAGRVLPVPCHYFVHSFASTASYNVTPAGESTMSGSGLVHMETNYGSVFPRGWVWVEAVDASGGALMMTGGKFIAGPLSSEAFLIGYRSPKVHWDMRTTDLDLISRSFDASAGVLRVVARQLSSGRELQVNLTADPSSFSQPLFVPTESGFTDRPGSVESFSAVARVAAWQGGELVEARTFTLAALEFGGDFRSAGAGQEIGGEPVAAGGGGGAGGLLAFA